MILTAILKIALATLKMEKFEMANEKIFIRKDKRTYSESLILVSRSAGLSQNPDVSISTIPTQYRTCLDFHTQQFEH